MSVRSVAQAGLSGVGKRPALTSAYDRSAFPGSFELISRVEVGAGGASSIEFTSIPGTFTHLQVRLLGRQTNTFTGGAPYTTVRLNGDTGSNYNYHALWADGASAYSDTSGTSTVIYPFRIASATQSANVFGVGVADILDYANTSKNTVVRGFSGYDNNGSGAIYNNSNLWMNTAAVTSITITPGQGNFAQFSRASLYGVIRNG